VKILVIGSGGREHALVWKLRQSPSVEKIWCAPGNGGIERDASCLPLEIADPRAAAELAKSIAADLTIVGPELPLVNGIADEFAARGITILAPSKRAAQLEGSKVFAKRFMERHAIPTAAMYGVLDSTSDIDRRIAKVKWPLVAKADGLCAGKGVLVTDSPDEARNFCERLLEKREFGPAGEKILLEEALTGQEISYIVLSSGEDFIPMAPARDHKRAFDGDHGPNTGGMGAYSTDFLIAPQLEKQIQETIVRPTLAGLVKDGILYRGFLFFGLMLTPEGPKVLEFNCRLGDPETQVILMRAEFDFASACYKAASGNLEDIESKWAPGASICVVMASEGYPEKPLTGKLIEGLEKVGDHTGAVLFHAGTRKEGGLYYTSGGRILGVAARGETLESASELAYHAVSQISIEGAHFRRDIGAALNASRKDEARSAR
jgi:phosphoribosylamine--glycine ligase